MNELFDTDRGARKYLKVIKNNRYFKYEVDSPKNNYCDPRITNKTKRQKKQQKNKFPTKCTKINNNKKMYIEIALKNCKR